MGLTPLGPVAASGGTPEASAPDPQRRNDRPDPPPRRPPSSQPPSRTALPLDDTTGVGLPAGSYPRLPSSFPERTRLTGWTLISRVGDDTDPLVPAAPRVLPEGTLINRNYRILGLVSVGGMGEVYRAENPFTGDPVAVKVILPALAGDAQMIDMFRREARVLVQLRAESIVRYHNFVLDDALGRYCLIMEFVEGPHLGDRMRDDRPLDTAEALALMRRLAEGLAEAHARGVTHRDLSPDNVILRGDDVAHAVLIDFGIARSTDFGDGLGGRFAGKFGFSAPEQLGQAGGVIGPQTDVYGLALLIASAVRGQPLSMGDTMFTAAQARRAIPDLGGISHRLYPLLQHMLEPDPADRPADMARVIALIDDPMKLDPRYRMPLWTPAKVEAGETVPSDAAPAPVPPRRARWLAPVLAALALLAAAALVPPLRDWAGDLAARLTGGGTTGEGVPAPLVPDGGTTPDWPPRDMASREGFLAAQPLPPCALAERIASGPDTGLIALYSAAPVEAGPLLASYDSAFGTRPEVVERPISLAQCGALDLVRTLSGRGIAPPVISASTSAVPGGFTLDARIMPGTAGGALWAALVAPDGAVYDMTALATPRPDGSVALDGVAVEAGAEAGDGYLLLALTSAQPLAAAAAAPAGTPAGRLMPALLAEMRAQAGDAPAAALLQLGPPE